MNLSPKTLRFTIEALQHYLADHERRFRDDGLSDDEISDLTNDIHYLRAIIKDFEQHREELARQSGKTKASA